MRELNGVEGWILDIATGTGDVSIEIVYRNGTHRKVFGLDFSHPMIKAAHQKIFKKKLSQRIILSLGDALFLPFRKNSFSASIMAFGLRNILNKEQALSEMVRVVKEGGKVIVLEFTFPQNGLMRRFYPLYFERVLPWVGGLISGHKDAYAYLPESVSDFRYAENYEEMMRRSGLKNVNSRSLTFGIASIIAGTKRP